VKLAIVGGHGSNEMPISVTKSQPQPDEREPKTLDVVWEPKEDITAYELAKLLPHALGTQPMYGQHWK
jgi:hypothetical protein